MEIDLTGLVLPERVEIAELSSDGRSAEFVMEPLGAGLRAHPRQLGTARSLVFASGFGGLGIPDRRRRT